MEYQQIAAVSSCASSLVRTLVVLERWGAGGDGLVFGTLLGPETTGPCGGSCVCGGCRVGLFVSGFPAMTVHVLCVCGVCGVGLLFENYIVDASILYKKQFPRY